MSEGRGLESTIQFGFAPLIDSRFFFVLADVALLDDEEVQG